MYNTFMRLVAAALSFALAWPGLATADTSFRSQDPVPVGVLAVGNASTGLVRQAANPASSPVALYSAAAGIFETVPEQATTAGAVRFQPQGWAKPDWMADPIKENRQAGFHELTGILGDTLKTLKVPDPWLRELGKGFAVGEALHNQGLVRQDGSGAANILTPNEMGAYIFTKLKTIGVFLNEEFPTLVRFLGPKLPLSTFVHEFDHANQDAEGRLSPKNKLAAEMHAFMMQCAYMLGLDPSGQVLARLRNLYEFVYPQVLHQAVPAVVVDYLEHCATIRRYGERNDWAGLIKAFGYTDRETRLPPRVTRS